jgi:uncharacterized protein YjdB
VRNKLLAAAFALVLLLCPLAGRAMFASADVTGAAAVSVCDIDFDGTAELLYLKDGALRCYAESGGEVRQISAPKTTFAVERMALTLVRKVGAGYSWRITLTGEGAKIDALLSLSGGKLSLKSAFRAQGGQYFVSGKRVSKSVYEKKWKAHTKAYPLQGIAAPTAAQNSGELLSAYASLPIKPIYPKKFALKKNSLSLERGKSVTFSYTISPAYATDRRIAFSTSNEEVARVEKDTGRLEAVGYGDAVITAETANGLISQCAVKVVRPSAKSVFIASDSGAASVVGRSTLQLSARVLPEDASQSVAWSSSNPSVARVSKAGLVTGAKAGKTTITAKTKNGRKATFTVTVTKPVSVKKVAFDARYREVEVGETAQISYSILPENAANKSLAWYSSDPSVATVEGGAVRANKTGYAIVTAVAASGAKCACYINVSGESGIARRALLIGTGNNDYVSPSTGIDDQAQKANEVAQIENMLRLQTFDLPIEITKAVNAHRSSDALNAIANAFSASDEDDVNYLYIVCHGSNPLDGVYTLMVGTDGRGITGRELREALRGAKGTFYIFIESCYSGDLIAKGGAAFDGEKFIESFTGGLSAKSGEMADAAFHILCSSRKTQESYFFWENAERNMSAFGYAISTAGGWKPALYAEFSGECSLAADADKNTVVSFRELALYASKKVKAMVPGDRQTMTYWPKTPDIGAVFHKEKP